MGRDEAYVSRTVRVVDWYCDGPSQRGDVIRMSLISRGALQASRRNYAVIEPFKMLGAFRDARSSMKMNDCAFDGHDSRERC